MDNHKLIYILNSYSTNEASHFEHIINLLQVMAEQDVRICLIVEKLQGVVETNHSNFKVYGLKSKNPFLRQIELFNKIRELIAEGYNASFIRITAWSTVTASTAHFIFGGRTYLWQSGMTHEFDRAVPMSFNKLKWYITVATPNGIARKCVTWFVTGPTTMVDYYSDIVGIPKQKIKLLYNDIDLQKFNINNHPNSKKQLLDRYRIEHDTVVLLLVHRLSPVRKTLMYLEPTLEKLKSYTNDRWVLFIAGGGSELPEAKRLVQTLGMQDKVIFLGNVVNKEIAYLYSASDIFIHPTYTEGFPRVLIEAMASGLPIVTTDAGGTAELIGTQQKKYLTSRELPNDFAHSVIELLDNKQDWQKLRIENLETVQKFSTENVAKMYKDVIFDE